MIFETNTQKSDITSAGGDGSGERADRRDQPVVYFVLPCYNEAEGLVHTADVLAAKVAHLTETGRISKQSRILFVDDGSKDGTWSIIRNLHERDAHLFGGVKLSHNRGHQNALLAGLMTARAYGCDAAISMDADLQDDVNAVDEFITDSATATRLSTECVPHARRTHGSSAPPPKPSTRCSSGWVPRRYPITPITVS